MSKKSYPIVHNDKHPFFTLVETGENVVRIVVGDKLASSVEFQTVQKALDYISKKPWELLVNTMCIVNMAINEKLKTKQNETVNKENA